MKAAEEFKTRERGTFMRLLRDVPRATVNVNQLRYRPLAVVMPAVVSKQRSVRGAKVVRIYHTPCDCPAAKPAKLFP